MDKKKKTGIKALSFGLAAVLALTAGGVLYAREAKETTDGDKSMNAGESAEAGNHTDSNKSSDTKKADAKTVGDAALSFLGEDRVLGKEETVYILAGADGSVKKVIVSDWLKNLAGEAELTDKSDLKDIENVKGEESYTINKDNMKVWDAGGKDIYYQGTTNKELPVELSIRYELDGKPISAENLAGKSGKVTMRFDYANKEQQTVEVDGRQENMYVPFVMVTGMILDNESFSNIQVSNGKLINDGDRSIVVGFALPGMQDNLQIDKEKLEIPDYVEITADVENFALTTTLTVATNDMFNGLELEDVNTFEELKASMEELKSASGQLVDGSSTLYEGTATLLDKSQELISGIDKLYAGAGQLKSGSETLKGGTASVNEGTNALKDGAASVNEGAGTLKNGIDALNDGAGKVKDGAASLQEGAAQVAAGAAQLDDGVKELQSGLGLLDSQNEALRGGAAQVFQNLLSAADSQLGALRSAGLNIPTLTIENYVAALTQTIAALDGNPAQESVKGLLAQLQSYQAFYDGLNQYTEGVSRAYGGSKELAAGSEALRGGTSELAKGSGDLALGSKELKDGAAALKSGAAALEIGTSELQKGAAGLASGTSKLQEGASSLADGANELYAGIGTLKDGSGALIDGVGQLKDGAMQLSDGMKEFEEQGIQKLADVFEGDLQSLVNRMKAMIDVSKNYQSFSGISEDMEGSVKFIYRTEEIGE